MIDERPTSAPVPTNPFEPSSREVAQKKFTAFGHEWQKLDQREKGDYSPA